jgi:uncharacterized membrane protein
VEKKSKKIHTADIVLIGMFAAVVFGGQFLRHTFPTPVGPTAISLGNIFILLAGFMLGPLRGGLASGLGAMLYNFTNPLLFAYWPFTLVFRFIHAFVCGMAAKYGKKLIWMYVAAAAGQLTYIVLFLAQRFFWDGIILLGMYPAEAFILLATPAVTALINGIVAVLAAPPLALALQKALKGRKI